MSLYWKAIWPKSKLGHEFGVCRVAYIITSYFFDTALVFGTHFDYSSTNQKKTFNIQKYLPEMTWREKKPLRVIWTQNRNHQEWDYKSLDSGKIVWIRVKE